MPFDWTPDFSPDQTPVLQNIRPSDILYEMDEPILFVSVSRRGLSVLCYKTDSDDGLSQYLVCPTNHGIINKIRNGNISLRSAISQPWIWVANATDYDFGVKYTWTLSSENIPDEVLPKEGRGLHNAATVIVERTTIRENDAYLSVKFHGGDIKNGTIPFGVIRNSLDEVYQSLWTIFANGVRRATTNVNDKTLRRIVNIPTYEMTHASLLIEIERPEIDLSTFRSSNVPNINIEQAINGIDEAHKSFLNSTQSIRNAMQRGALTQTVTDSNFDAIEAVAPIIPRQNSFFEAVEINGRHPERATRPLVISAQQGRALREIYEESRSALRTIQGEVFLINSRSSQFTMIAGVRNVTCVATSETQKERISELRSGDWVVVRGYLTPRAQRDLMQIQTLQVDGLTVS
jgi:hypothetical protein